MSQDHDTVIGGNEQAPHSFNHASLGSLRAETAPKEHGNQQSSFSSTEATLSSVRAEMFENRQSDYSSKEATLSSVRAEMFENRQSDHSSKEATLSSVRTALPGGVQRPPPRPNPMSAEQIARNEAFFAADDEKHFQASFDEETKRRLGGSFAAFQERLAARREAASTMENPRPHVDTPRSGM